MLKHVNFFVGFRYLRAQRRSQWVSFISLLSMLGLILGVAALITVMSVMNGFDIELKQRLLKALPHAEISPSDQASMAEWPTLAKQLEEEPGVIAVAPYIQSKVMLVGNNSSRAVQLVGIDPERERKVSDIASSLLSGDYQSLQPSEYGIIIGSLLAQQLGAYVGSDINLVVPEFRMTALGVQARARTFRVVGVFEVGAQIDSSTAFIHLHDAARLFRFDRGSAAGLRVEVADMFQVDTILAPYKTQWQVATWMEANASLFAAIATEKIMMTLLLMIVVLVAAFNVVSIMTTLVNDKRSDIAVLRIMGASDADVRQIFIVTGTCIGLIGTGIGCIIGTVLAFNIGDIVAVLEQGLGIRVFDPNIYFITRIPSQFELGDLLTVAVSSLCLTWIAAAYPAFRASKVLPAEALQYD